VTCYRQDFSVCKHQCQQKDFLFFTSIHTGAVAQSALLYNGHQGSLPEGGGGRVAGGMALTTHPHLALRLRIVQLYFYTSSVHTSHVTVRLLILSSVHLHLFSWEYLPINPRLSWWYPLLQ
jgi:hypothetical protein